MKKIIGTGIFNWDSISVREYPQGPQRNRIFDEKLVLEEVGGTCGNVMCILSHFGWEAFPVTNLDRSEEGLGMTESLKEYGCDCRFVTNTDEGGTTILTIKHRLDENVVDWDGAGDWTTSTFLNALAEADVLSIMRLTSEVVKKALVKAQIVASKSVSYMGSKGMINKNY